jgi:hypothetical protein
MKRIFLALAISVLFLPAPRQANGAEVSVDFFYNNLSGGSWVEVGDYGYCWQPDVAANDPSWRPYTDGYWAYTDVGWTWVSYEDFGWATYHYGRWVRLSDYGWMWVPGRNLEWGPAWVSWRTGGAYIGWAPLPPEGEVVYEGRPITGQVDIEFDIGPAYYNFCDVRYIGEPVLRERIVDSRQNVTYINQTVNVTNITYKNKTVYNYGPDINVVNQYSSRPVQRLKLERQENVDVSAAAKSGALMKPQGDRLVVAAPMKINKSAQQVAPPNVKTKVAQPKIEKGWSVAGDANAQAELKQKIKTQDLKKVPPPTGAGAAAGTSPAVAGGSPAASVAPMASASPTAAGSPFGKGKKGKAADQFQPGATVAPGGSPGVGTSPVMTPEYGKPGKGKRGEQFRTTPPITGPTAGPEGAASPSGAAATEYGKPGKAKRGEQFRTAPPVTGPTAGPEGVATPPGGKHKGFERGNVGPTPGGAASPSENLNEPRGKHKQFEQPTTSPSGPQGGPPTGAQGAPYGEGRGKHKAEGVNAPPSGAPAGAGPAATAAVEGKHEGKKKGEKEASPVPSPQ